MGAAYLIFLGLKALRSANSMHAVVLGADPLEKKQRGLRGVYLGALALQLANPKALLFFLALLPQFIDPSRPVVPQMLILAATSMIPEFCILTGYGWLAHRAAHATATATDCAILRPRIAFGTPVDAATLDRIHHQAHAECFIANSVKTEISVEPRG